MPLTALCNFASLLCSGGAAGLHSGWVHESKAGFTGLCRTQCRRLRTAGTGAAASGGLIDRQLLLHCLRARLLTGRVSWDRGSSEVASAVGFELLFALSSCSCSSIVKEINGSTLTTVD